MAHPMRRTDREITDAAEIDRLLSQARFATIALADGDEPYVVTLSCGFDAAQQPAVLPCRHRGTQTRYHRAQSQGLRDRRVPTSATSAASVRTRSSRW